MIQIAQLAIGVIKSQPNTRPNISLTCKNLITELVSKLRINGNKAAALQLAMSIVGT